MILGRVTVDREPVLPIRVRGLHNLELEVDVGVDTGYNGFLTLPKAIIEKLELPFWGTAQASLGDGNDVDMDVYLALASLNDTERGALVLEAEGGALIGMSMLDGCRLTIDVEEGGPVLVEPLPASRKRQT